jgi:3-hydroxyisobutyrate dehydrogenase
MAPPGFVGFDRPTLVARRTEVNRPPGATGGVERIARYSVKSAPQPGGAGSQRWENSVNVAFLGLGRMGAPMARHVLDAGHDLRVWNRTTDKAAELVAAGAAAAASPAEAARGADVVVTMLADPDAVREVLLGPDGVAEGATEGTLVIDASTIGPGAAREIAVELAKRGLRYVDAPVLGSVQPARDGTLTVFAGGSEAEYAEVEPLLRLWGDPTKVRRVGDVGSASAVKLVLNLTIGVATAGVGEALRLAADLGVDRHVALDALAAGPLGATVGSKRTMLEKEEYSPVGFSLDLLAKDLGLVVDAAHGDLPVTESVRAVVDEAVTAGHGDDDYAALAGYLAFEGRLNSY